MELSEISLITSLWIIIIFATVFFLLLWLLVIKRRRILKTGLADEEILRNLRKKYRQFFYDKWLISKNNAGIPVYSLSNSPTLIRAKNSAAQIDESQSLEVVLSKKEGKLTGWSMLGVGICGTLIGLCAILATTGIFYHSTKAPIRIGDGEYRLMKSDDLGDGNKGIVIRKNALVGFEKKEFNSLKEGEIIAFYDQEKNEVFIRRIDSRTQEGNIVCLGDYEEKPQEFEMNITSDRYLGTFNGYNNYGAGITVGFIKSDFGIITLYFMGVAIYICTYCFTEIDYIYQKRELELAKGVDKQNEMVNYEEVARLNNRMG